jgi:hypothetical protein
VVDVTVGPGDAVSRLLQVIAKDVGVKDVRWTGKSNDDIRLVLTRMYNAELVKDSLWEGMMTLARMKEWLELSESIQAQVFAIILRARALIELGSKAQS